MNRGGIRSTNRRAAGLGEAGGTGVCRAAAGHGTCADVREIAHVSPARQR
ncbi:hypothetical protein [Lentzea sp. NEAU-D7]|nr:hypothetical protein [Lentzea sp. NEAU-D7]MCX2953702.1 hypothetical protein [Lentzea sp. NEAU-D7]